MFRKLAAHRLARRAKQDADGRVDAPTPAPEESRPGIPQQTQTRPVVPTPLPTPDYFGFVPNYANSPLPHLDPAGQVVPGTGLRKFVDSLPGVGEGQRNDLGNYLPVATPDTVSYPGCDYYEIGLEQFTQQLHADLGQTRLRGYRQLNSGTDANGRNTVGPPKRAYHLGPVIVADRDRPVRVKFVNGLPTGPAGRLPLPVDSTVRGAGTGPLGGSEHYPQNRAVLHLHGAATPWISNGGPDQWLTPAGEQTPYPTGTSLANVPDMAEPEPGAVTLYYPNQSGGRLLWYHDHTLGIARLTVYSGQLGLYLLRDEAERQLVADGVVPADEIPLVIQDKTFVPGEAQLEAQDPTWDRANWGGRGSLWYPHVYMPNQNPYNESGTNPMGRWDYGPWFWPPYTGTAHGPARNPYHDPAGAPWQPPVMPGTPNPSVVPEAFLDTPLVNGCAYPYLRVAPKAYRFRILNACNDRSLNLQLYYAASDGPMWQADGTLGDGSAGEVPMVDATANPDHPGSWPTDGRAGGVPDPASIGPDWIQIGTEGGLLPEVAVVRNQPINYVYNRRDIAALNVSEHSLLLGPGERADVIVDFSSAPPGSKIILYNDCPAPMPAFDTRYDYYTGDPDRTAAGGAPSTQPGYGPNTRTLLQFQVAGEPEPPYDLERLRARLPLAYGASQPPPIVPQPAYDTAFGTRTPKNTHVPIHSNTITFTPAGRTAPVTLPLRAKAIQELFEPEYGRMNATLGVELPKVSALVQTTTPLTYVDPPTEILAPADPAIPIGSPGDGTQIWKITHNGAGTRAIHFHHLMVQLINRVGWDGAIRPPDPNELGWKETVRMNPLEDTVVAVRPTLPDPLPFKVGDSVRLLDPNRPPGTTDGFTQVNPRTGDPAVVTNQLFNFGWEYAWQGHLVGHEGSELSRPLVLRVSPAQPTGLTATAKPGSPTVPPSIALAWTNNATRPVPTNHLVERATNVTFTAGVTTFSLPPGVGTTADSTVTPGTTYYYRVRTETAVGYSGWSNTASAVVRLIAPSGLTASVAPAAPVRVDLAWRNRSFATGVEIQRAVNPTFSSGLVTVSGPLTAAWSDGTVTPNTTYYHRVRTSYLGAPSPWSTVSVVTVPTVPAVPHSLSATASVSAPDSVSVQLSWFESGGSVVSGFTLQRANDPSFSTGLTSFTIAGTARSFTNTGLPRDTVYHWRIQAFNAVGTSAFTGPLAVHPPD
ncbi:fibronectin type III domain-containing protein [Micromonospora sp. NBC_01699]|nr:fibronectin type III domain-containing protein [Micromonospora sp. NBC_01699]